MGKEIVDIELDKSAFSVVSFSDLSDDRDYWFTKTPIERLRHIELLRRINYGHNADERLQRILEFIED
jgi:hypothetical protein